MTTDDGSKTIHMPDLNEQYHSRHGALQEALHVFIDTGLEHFLEVSLSRKRNFQQNPIKILEYGFGTGLNAMVTALHDSKTPIVYTAVEAYPVNDEEVKAMDYGKLLGNEEMYEDIHQCSWEERHQISNHFSLTKQQKTFEQIADQDSYDLIFFDAFGPSTQPELWTVDIFTAAYNALKSNGVLTTYCAAGQVRRNMQSVGFIVERLPGPPGKREMLRATKSL
ncbi:tRNA U34 5-methylaminomethyl-2-thiouridine-forming methyltransferase MnmC [Nonlabens xylanidelens]|uniref:tRNA U34 5-methylaminomethyl-2-thiouridine-forming methyltransferase MnmC n=2 Tax=Nonlabens xylanidelens TaxID=191564 RepID=A0A2S6IMJ3_9FLAO|nr:tRNA U34 5-methylaminomethyl-2-thiouridine-forming methyltransferase MnmC [Nonlabens xylanidelens]